MPVGPNRHNLAKVETSGLEPPTPGLQSRLQRFAEMPKCKGLRYLHLSYHPHDLQSIGTFRMVSLQFPAGV